jgi:hypothetical protein
MRKRIKLEALRTAIHAGDESGIAEGDVFEEVRRYIQQVETERKRNRYQQARNRAVCPLAEGLRSPRDSSSIARRTASARGATDGEALMELNKAASQNPSGYGPEDAERLVDEARAAKKEKRTD